MLIPCLTMSRPAACHPAIRAAVKLSDSATQHWIGGRVSVRIAGKHHFVAVVVHADLAAWANHFAGGFSHGNTLPRELFSRNLFAVVSQSLRHPDQFLEELVHAADEGFV